MLTTGLEDTQIKGLTTSNPTTHFHHGVTIHSNVLILVYPDHP